jgi:hypothetical protein
LLLDDIRKSYEAAKEEWEYAQKIQNDIDYWLYRAYKELGLFDQDTAIKLMDYLHEEIRKKYEVYEPPEDKARRLKHNAKVVKEWLRRNKS